METLRPWRWPIVQQAISRLWNCVFPLLFILSTCVRAIPRTVGHMLLRQPGSLFRLDTWRAALFAYQWPLIAASEWADAESVGDRRQLLSGAYGTTLEVGAGIGDNFKHYPDGVTRVYAVEPCVGLHDALLRSAKKSGLAGRVRLIDSAVEDTAALSKAGVGPKSIDTIVCIHVLCTVDDAQRTMRALQRLLKDGGQIIFFEHCKSKDPYTRRVQNIYNTFWPYLVYHCQLNRPLDQWLMDLPGWNEPSTRVEDVSPVDAGHQLIYNVRGRLVKMKYN